METIRTIGFVISVFYVRTVILRLRLFPEETFIKSAWQKSFKNATNVGRLLLVLAKAVFARGARWQRDDIAKGLLGSNLSRTY